MSLSGPTEHLLERTHMPADLANIGAATAAGYREVVSTRPDGSFVVMLERYLGGDAGQSGAPWRAYGQGSSQAAAETQALASLNSQRRHRYAGTGSHGGSLTTDAS